MEVDCPSENQAKIKEGQVALDRVSQCGCCHKIGEAKAKILGLSFFLYGTNWHAVGVSKTWNPGPQIVLVLLHLLPNMWVCLKIRYPSVSSNSPLHEHQIAIFWEHPIFSGRKSQFVQIA